MQQQIKSSSFLAANGSLLEETIALDSAPPPAKVAVFRRWRFLDRSNRRAED